MTELGISPFMSISRCHSPFPKQSWYLQRYVYHTKGPAPHEILRMIHPCVEPTKHITPIPISECQKQRALTSEHSLPNHSAVIRSRARLNYMRSEHFIPIPSSFIYLVRYQ